MEPIPLRDRNELCRVNCIYAVNSMSVKIVH